MRVAVAPTELHHRRVRRATVTSLAAAVLFSMMALGVRALSQRIPGAQIAFVRFAAGIVVVALLASSGQIDLRPRRWGWLVSRGLAGGLAVVAYFMCIEHVGVGVATLLNHTGPVWSLLFAWLLLREAPPPRALFALALTMVGVVLVAGHGGGAGALGVGYWEGVAVLSAMASGWAVTSIRAVRRPRADGLPGEGSWTVFASFTGLGLVATLPWVIGHWVAPTPREWLILIATAVLSIAAQLAMTRALAVVTAVSSGVILQFTVVLTMLGGIGFYGEALDRASAIGAVLTMAGVVWMAFTSAPARTAGVAGGER